MEKQRKPYALNIKKRVLPLFTGNIVIFAAPFAIRTIGWISFKSQRWWAKKNQILVWLED